jgi:predicted enzyme related to lactoylglutathione lyase
MPMKKTVAPTAKNLTANRRNSPAGADAVDARLARPGALSYLEIPALDARHSAEFYERVLGWLPRDSDAGHPKFSDPDGHLIGRWVTGRAACREPGLLPFIYVKHVRKTVEAVTVHGGEVVKAPYPEGNLLVAVIRDPAGNVIGLWQDNGGR